VSDAARMLAVRIRAGHGPALLEAKTYRYCGHSKSDARAYRSRDEEAIWRRKDPVLLLEKRVAGMLGDDEIEKIRTQAMSEIEDAYQSALMMREPGPQDAFEGVYAATEDYVPQGNL
ncbi:MAG: thiamine pyrophosphate-dependent enzyme, partial [Deltaproteobacteria bacterium]